MNKKSNVGKEVIITDYFEKGVSEYGIIKQEETFYYIVETQCGHEYYAFFSSEGKSWEVMRDEFEDEEMTATEFKEWFEKVVNESEDRKLKRWINDEMKIPNVLNKEDYNKLLNRAIDLQEWEEATRIAKKMEVL